MLQGMPAMLQGMPAMLPGPLHGDPHGPCPACPLGPHPLIEPLNRLRKASQKTRQPRPRTRIMVCAQDGLRRYRSRKEYELSQFVFELCELQGMRATRIWGC